MRYLLRSDEWEVVERGWTYQLLYQGDPIVEPLAFDHARLEVAWRKVSLAADGVRITTPSGQTRDFFFSRREAVKGDFVVLVDDLNWP